MRVYPITLFFVEDSAEDRTVYRRFLEHDDRYSYDIYEFESGKQALQGCQWKTPDVILLDYRLPDIDGLELMNKLQQQTEGSQTSVIMLTGQGDETIAVQAIKSGAQDYLVKGKLTSDNLRRAVHGAIKQMQLMRQLKQQQEQQKLVGAIALDIRQSLKLQDILATSVQEVRQLLSADRVVMYQFTPQMQGNIVAESVLSQWTPIFGLEIEDTCFQENQGEEYRRGKIWAATNIYEAGLSDCHINLLEQFQVKANLVVPILLENKGSSTVELWGLFIVHQCSAPRQWQEFEVELLNQLTVQLAIAIQQAELYHNLQTLNTELEAKVQERTAKLQQSERRFCAIFNNTFQFTGLLTLDGILLEANQTALSFGGLKLEDVINRPFWEAHWWTISPQTQEELKQAIARAAQGEFVRYQVDILGANNRVATIDFSLRPLLDEMDRVVLLIPEGRDITEQQTALRDRQKAEEKLRQSETLLATTQQIAHIGSWEFNLETKKLCWSIETFRIFGLNQTQSEPTQEEFLQMIHPDDRDWMNTHMEQVMSKTSYAYAQGTPFTVEFRVVRPDGSVRYVETKAEIAYGSQGQAVKLLGSVLDITERKQTELEIIKSRDLLEAVYNESADALFLVNVETLLTTDCNEQAVKLFAASSKAELINIADHTLQKQQFTPNELDSISEKIKQQSLWSQEIEYVTKQGNTFWGNMTAKQITVAGTVMQLVRVTDITARKRVEEYRKQAETALRQSEERLQLALEASGDGLWDWNILTQEVYYSPLFLKMLGYSFEELPQNLSTWERLVHPDDLPWVKKILADHLKDSSVSYKFNYRVQTKSGEWKWIANYGKVVMRDEQGKPLRMTGTHRDISDVYDELQLRKQTEAALARSEEQLRLTLEFNHIGIWDWNLQTGEVIWNDNHYRLLGLEPEISAASYQLWRNRVHLEDVDRIEQAVLDALAQHTNFQGEYRVIYPNGSVHWLTGKGRGVYNEAGDPIQMLGVIIDITERKQAEAALQESEARFQAFMNNSPVLAWISDTDGRILYSNQTYLRTFKLLPEQVIGQSIFDLYTDKIARQHFDHIQTVIQTNQVIEAIEVAPRPDGILGEFLVYKFPILGLSAQKLVGRVAIDITERKILERELAHKQKLLDTFINSAPVGITIMDRELRYSLINEALAEINGIPPATHIGKTPWEIVPDLAQKLEQIFQHILTTGEPILDLEISGETPKLPGVIRTWLASYFPIQSEADEPISMGIVVVEISDRKRAEQMLELQAVITRNMAEGICLVRTTDGVFVYANPKFEQMFGYDPGELIGQHVAIVNYGDKDNTPEDINRVISTAVLEHGEATYEVHNIKKDGTPFWCSATASVFRHPEYGSVVVAIHQDITEQKQAEEKIKASLKEKEVLLKEIHHRVKNNLGIVSSLLQMQCRRTQDPVVTAILRDSQNRIASIALVHEKLYRSEDLADIDFAQYIPDLTTHLFDSYNVSSSQIKLNIQVDNASLDIETAIPCALIINELVSNALKYAFIGNRGGEIQVKFSQESDRTLILIIRDNGVGLPKNFDSKKAKTLGITLVQGLVKQLRGKLEIDSQHGTQFKITFTNSRTT
ncbi:MULTISPECIES: PAS domain S-box protein [unclassified Nostoc]|uniref:PAS domain S-box protein n=1 Tax=unclassified Nostoc TaxID=2593658 RepID=UPI002AD358DD|nr:PAS domain S-box protein [Nostoc sp. DedQUE03]MDZ7971336.1 PAS domain S-box protein [Nostoc sp. DedQUE03]MDZ8043702.1 PAS domain S-box protein [Nostoc sp. DedQUE02]